MVLTSLFSCVNKRSIFYWKNRDWSTFVWVCVCVCEMVEMRPEESICEFSQIHTNTHTLIVTHAQTHLYAHKGGKCVRERLCVNHNWGYDTQKCTTHYILLSFHWKLWYWCSRWWKENKYRYKITMKMLTQNFYLHKK